MSRSPREVVGWYWPGAKYTSLSCVNAKAPIDGASLPTWIRTLPKLAPNTLSRWACTAGGSG
jgi:hypothetical protein